MFSQATKTKVKATSIILLVTGVLLLIFPCFFNTVSAQNEVNVQGTVEAAAPQKPAVIKNPKEGQRFSSSPIVISGSCSGNTTVEIYKNSVFAGSSKCQNNKFILKIDLLLGKNKLIAKIRDSLGQYGPDSKSVSVTYISESSSSVSSEVEKKKQLLLVVDSEYSGIFPKKDFGISPQILGGEAPYAIDIDWGDEATTLVARQSNGIFNEYHQYEEPGVKIISISASDSKKRTAFIQTVAIVNGIADNKASKINQPSATTDWTDLFTTKNIATSLFLIVILGVLLGVYLGYKGGYKKGRVKHTDDRYQ